MSSSAGTPPQGQDWENPLIAQAYNELVRPTFVDAIHLLGIDVVFHRAEGDQLYYYDRDGREVGILDMVGGSGATILGHNHPILVAYASELLSRRIPFHGQRSVRRYAAELACALNELLQAETDRRYVITYANSGSEANELAVKHAYFERQAFIDEWYPRIVAQDLSDTTRLRNEKLLRSDPIFIAIEDGFHGKTNTSLALSHSPSIKVPALNHVQPTVYVRANSADDLRAQLSRYEERLQYVSEGVVTELPYTPVLGVICEPILGDGGIIELQDEFLVALREWTSSFNVPLIFDEIQSGIGRTGDFLASSASGAVGDYYTLSKALSGGIGKVSIVAIDANRFVRRFGLVHSSTYNEDDWSSAISLKALELFKEYDICRLARESGNDLRGRLLQLMGRHQGLIADIRGRGLMLGIAWSPEIERLIPPGVHAAQYIEGLLFTGQRVRVGTAIATRLITRLTPSALMSKDSRDWFIDACGSLCGGLARGESTRPLGQR